MLKIKHIYLIIFLFLSIDQSGYCQTYNPSLNITNPSTISTDGYVSYTTTSLSTEDARFTLFGDGYFSFQNNFSHQFQADNSGFVTTTYFNRKYKKHVPTTRDRPTGSTGSGGGNNTLIGINPGSNTKVGISWSPSPNIENYFLLIFENRSQVVDAGCIEFYFKDTELSLNNGGILEYGWVNNKVLSTITGLSNFNKKLKWQFSNLLPGEQRVVYIPMTSLVGEGSNLNVGSKYSSGCSSDSEISTETVLASGSPHDPNVKTANKKYVTADLETQQSITYTIRFQNEGTGVAKNVILEDVLDDQLLDLTSVDFLDSEYPYSYSLDGNKLTIEFKDINLPGLKQSGRYTYTYDDTESYIQFEIKTLSNLERGEILNQAAIIFDDQSAIYTDVSVVAITDQETNEEYKYDISIVPNPVESLLFIEGIEDQEVLISIYNETGQLVLSKSKVTAVNKAIQVDALPSGVYFIEVKNEMIDITKKVIKL